MPLSRHSPTLLFFTPVLSDVFRFADTVGPIRDDRGRKLGAPSNRGRWYNHERLRHTDSQCTPIQERSQRLSCSLVPGRPLGFLYSGEVYSIVCTRAHLDRSIQETLCLTILNTPARILYVSVARAPTFERHRKSCQEDDRT